MKKILFSTSILFILLFSTSLFADCEYYDNIAKEWKTLIDTWDGSGLNKAHKLANKHYSDAQWLVKNNWNAKFGKKLITLLNKIKNTEDEQSPNLIDLVNKVYKTWVDVKLSCEKE